MTTVTTLPARLWAFVRLGRPSFLAGGFLMHGLGVAMALYASAPLNLPALLWGQLAITATQLMVHYSSEFFDQAADRANPTPTRWAGGSRVLTDGHLPPEVALATAIVLGGLALAAALVLALAVRPGLLTLGLLLLALLLGWGYSTPPLRIDARGLGELTVAFLVPGLTPFVGFYLQAGTVKPLPLLAVLPLCCLQVATQLTTEFPDATGDAATGKRTLVVRLGSPGAARLHNLVLLAAYGLLPLLVPAGLPPLVAIAACLSAPVALWQAWRVGRGAWTDPARWDSLAFWGIGLLMGTAAAETLAFLWLLASS
ncbi:MAG: prenyltransferase [Anaerolineae bacterium]|nr:MAG: prenyltransferase [Anaerolineae bacterium]